MRIVYWSSVAVVIVALRVKAKFDTEVPFSDPVLSITMAEIHEHFFKKKLIYHFLMEILLAPLYFTAYSFCESMFLKFYRKTF